MKSMINIIKGTVIGMTVLAFTSCNLDLAPIDFYGSGNYWQTEAHFDSYMIGLRSDLRKNSWMHTFVMGESRGGSVKGNASIGSESPNYGSLANQAIHVGAPGITGFGDYYGRITNLNLFIQRTEETDVLDELKQKKLLAQAYGMRAFWYFDLYRIYGSCPLQLEAKVVNGIVDPEQLYEGRANASVVMAQIKEDLQKSLDYFGTDISFASQKSTWSKAATEALIADVYLWTAKVTTLDDPANPADIEVAKRHLLNLTTDYGLELLPNYADVYDATPNKKGHSEAIMAIRYTEGEATNNHSLYVYNWTTSIFNNAWEYDTGEVTTNDTLKVMTSGQHRIEYKKQMYENYDPEDTRRAATFLPVYYKSDHATNAGELAGTFFRKNLGLYNAEKNQRIYCGDELWYRLSWVYLALAEVENFQGGDPATYINIVRKRAYGDDWDINIHGYVNADFTTNELAILKEKDRELVGEGQRWWDVRRMTITKGGDALVFRPEANYGSTEPILRKADQSHMVLFPIEVNMINKDPDMTQTPGWETEEEE